MLVVLAVIAALAGCGMPTATHTVSTSTPASAALNQPVRDGEFEFVVSAVGPVPEHWYGPHPPPGGEWIIATMTVRNAGSKPQSFSVRNQKLIDSAGRQYGPDMSAAVALNPAFMVSVNDVNPGFAIGTLKVPFGVPDGTRAAAIEVHDSAFSDGARVTLG
jgi:hypothetical protein